MEDKPINLTVQSVRNEAAQTRVISLNGGKVWSFTPGQIAVLGIEGVGESYFAIASAPEDKEGMEFLVKKGGGVSEALFEIKKGDSVQAKGPVGKGYPIEQYRGRDLVLACVGSAIAPMRSVLRSVCNRRADFGKIVLFYGARYPEDFSFAQEVKDLQKSGIDVVLTVSRPEGKEWTGKTGHVQSHFGEVLKGLSKPVALICGMKAMMEESREELTRLGVAADEILTNF
jgi:sulfhydrogenase subunit gamma (sulfur reductase)